MANEFKHKEVGIQLTEVEFDAVDAHEADGQTTNDMLYFNGTSWIRATPATILTLLSAAMGAAFSFNDQQLSAVKQIQYTAPTELTLDVDGALTVTQAFHTVDTYSNAASDDLTTINGGTAGMIIFLRAVHGDRTVVVKHNTGNIWLPGALDISLDDIEDGILLTYDGSHWCGVEVALTAHIAAADPHTVYVKHSLATATSDFLVGTVGAWVKKTLAETRAILKHAITSTDDHTSTATSGRMLKADANGLPVDATNTDTDVADAVTKKHAANADTDLDPTFEATFMKNSILTERGSIIYRNATVPAELKHGTDGQVLTTKGDGADPEWTEVIGGIAKGIVFPTTSEAGDYFHRTDDGKLYKCTEAY